MHAGPSFRGLLTYRLTGRTVSSPNGNGRSRGSRRLTPEVLVQDVLTRQKDVHTVQIAERPQRPAKQNPVEARQYACDAALVPLQKTLHDDPPYDVWQKHHAGNRLGRHLFWLRPKAALQCKGSFSSQTAKKSVAPAPKPVGTRAGRPCHSLAAAEGCAAFSAVNNPGQPRPEEERVFRNAGAQDDQARRDICHGATDSSVPVCFAAAVGRRLQVPSKL